MILKMKLFKMKLLLEIEKFKCFGLNFKNKHNNFRKQQFSRIPIKIP